MSPERYFSCYASLLESNENRYFTQPIYDTNLFVYDDEGEPLGYEIVGYRQYDLAPEWEWLRTIETMKGEFKAPGGDDLLALRREYAWNYNQPFTRAKLEQEQREADEAKLADQKRRRLEAAMEGVDEAKTALGKRVSVSVG